jgi:hypothetical protein
MQPLMQADEETIKQNEVKREIGFLHGPENAVLLGIMKCHVVT